MNEQNRPATHFASPERSSREEILADYGRFRAYPLLIDLLDALPSLTVLLNHNRQIVFANASFLEFFKTAGIDSVLGLRTGEIMGCVHRYDMEAGCGTAEACSVCGVIQTVLDNRKESRTISGEAMMTARSPEGEISYDLMITASPFIVDDRLFTVVSIGDISDRKRKQKLERIFFHDIINTAGGIRSFFKIAGGMTDPEEIKKLFVIAGNLSKDLIEEILMQRDLMLAESGELKVSAVELRSKAFIGRIAEQYRHHQVAEGKEIRIDEAGGDTPFTSDEIILKRVVGNMMKNALEASPAGSAVTCGSAADAGTVSFWVRNQGSMEREARLRMFKRSFSTKGSDRGLGTYSMKLLTERYLRGTVAFETSEDRGITFTVTLPRGGPAGGRTAS